MKTAENPSLFGLEHSNRMFSKPDAWGKNQFNSSFPASLLCWMGTQELSPVYLRLDSAGQFIQDKIEVSKLFGLAAKHPSLFFAFEDAYTPYSDLLVGTLPRADLVTRDHTLPQKNALAAFEIKLTALPDNTTHHQSEALWGCEIVVRPDTIVYLALSLANAYRHNRQALVSSLELNFPSVFDWTEATQVQPLIGRMIAALEQVFVATPDAQKPILLQPVFKTLGKKSILFEQCFDYFVWSNFALARLFFAQSQPAKSIIMRHERSTIWLYKMLWDFGVFGQFDAKHTIDRLTYNLKNDKAFASSGSVTQPYMRSAELASPRVPKLALREIILGGGHLFLSPERRLDAIIVNTPGLF